jgi:hypothetical protein
MYRIAAITPASVVGSVVMMSIAACSQGSRVVVPLWDGKAKLRARMALPDESALFAEAKNNGQPSDGLILVYLVKLDGGETDEQPVDPGAFPPARS